MRCAAKPYRTVAGQHHHRAIHSVQLTRNGYAMISTCSRGSVHTWDTRYMARIVAELTIDSMLSSKLFSSGARYQCGLLNPENENQLAFQTSTFSGVLDLSAKKLIHIVDQHCKKYFDNLHFFWRHLALDVY